MDLGVSEVCGSCRSSAEGPVSDLQQTSLARGGCKVLESVFLLTLKALNRSPYSDLDAGSVAPRHPVPAARSRHRTAGQRALLLRGVPPPAMKLSCREPEDGLLWSWCWTPVPRPARCGLDLSRMMLVPHACRKYGVTRVSTFNQHFMQSISASFVITHIYSFYVCFHFVIIYCYFLLMCPSV